MKTIKQIADEIGVDKLRVYRYIRKQRISETYREHRTEYYDETAEALIARHFGDVVVSSETFHERITDTPNDTIISMLQRELDAKNGQLAAKDRQIADLTAALIGA